MANKGGVFGYGETELEPAIQSEIHLATARNEARIAILEILVAIGFGLFNSFDLSRARQVYIFCLITVVPLLIDAAMRRSAAKRLRDRT